MMEEVLIAFISNYRWRGKSGAGYLRGENERVSADPAASPQERVG